MPLYYRGPEARITHEVFAVQVPYPQTYPISELHDVCIVRDDRRPRAGRIQELRATYRQLDVLLYASADPTRFGQVARALARALRDREENLRHPSFG